MIRRRIFTGILLFVFFIVYFLFATQNSYCDSSMKIKSYSSPGSYNGHKFSFDLFSEVVKNEPDNNLFISPLSAIYALTMVLNGAEGTTKDEMKNVLGLEDYEIGELNSYLKNLTKYLTSADKQVELSIANSIWSNPKFNFKSEYFDVISKSYDAELNKLTDAKIINDWVSKKTRGRISKIIERISPSDVMALINAIYFKAKWTEQFKKGSTQIHDFYLRDGSIKKHPLMYQSGKYDYFETEDFQAITLPYGNKNFSMYIFLPKAGHTLQNFIERLTEENWINWNQRFQRISGAIYLPRFKMEYQLSLNNVLIAMGMPLAFDQNRADLSGMINKKADENYFISEALQKTFVEVNEKGTEAAAATAINMRIMACMEPEPTFIMKIDHPFFCAIVDQKTGELLFMGAIYNPEE
jgi:serine protease inhibitor